MQKELFIFITLYSALIIVICLVTLFKYRQKNPSIITTIFKTILALLAVFFLTYLYYIFNESILSGLALLMLIFIYWDLSKKYKKINKKSLQKLKRDLLKEPIKFKDFFTLRGGVKLSLKYGIKKAALWYTFIGILSAIGLLLIFYVLFPEENFTLEPWLFSLAWISILLYYSYMKRFEKFVQKKKRKR